MSLLSARIVTSRELLRRIKQSRKERERSRAPDVTVPQRPRRCVSGGVAAEATGLWLKKSPIARGGSPVWWNVAPWACHSVIARETGGVAIAEGFAAKALSA